MPPPLFRPEGLQATPGSDHRLAGKQGSCPPLVGRRASRNAGANALGCEIKEEASAIGRRRGTFAPKGIRTRRPAICRRVLFLQSREEDPAANYAAGGSVAAYSAATSGRTASGLTFSIVCRSSRPRSEERRLGKEWVSTCRSWWSR